MKKCVFYGRYSSAMQNEQSIEGQFSVVKRFAEQNGYAVIAEYIDRAMTGTSDKRPEFQRMIADSANHGFEAVIVYKLDRFARNRYDSAIYKKRLRENGVRVVSATENISDTPEGMMMEAFVEAMDEYYSAELSRKMKRGKEESLRKGLFIAKAAPYGYKKVNHRLEIDEDKANTAVEIFQRFSDGETQQDIADSLNARGYVNSVGKKWSAVNISNILRCQVYTGKYRAGSLEVEGTAPQLISNELFEKVQKRRETFINSHRKTYSDFDFYLSGKLICNCGGTVSGFSTGQGKYHYYRCARKCGLKNFKAESLHERVKSALQDYLTEEKSSEIAKVAFTEYQKTENQISEREVIEKKIADTDRQLNNAVSAILSGITSNTLKSIIENLEQQKDKLQKTLDSVSAPAPKLTQEHFLYALKTIVSKAYSCEPQELVDAIVNKIFIFPERIIICINLTDNSNTPPLEQILLSLKDNGISFKLSKIQTYSNCLLIIA